MAKGMSVHIGLNAVDPKGYDGWGGPLVACENDARDLQAIAEKQGFKTKLLLTPNATAAGVTSAIRAAAKSLAKGDTFIISYSGHGGQIPDESPAGVDDEDDGLDETWCLFDRQLIDDELFSLWSEFEKGVRIFVLSDSCHSGSVVRAVANSGVRIPIRGEMGALDYSAMRIRAMPIDVQRGAFEAQKKTYVRIQKKLQNVTPSSVGASVVLISGCLDNQTSADGDQNGLFTEKLLHVWDNGAFKGSIKSFHKAILHQMPFVQSPNFFEAGTRSAKFEQSRPFTI